VPDRWYPPANPEVKRWLPEKIPFLRAECSIMQRLVAGLHAAVVPLLARTGPFAPCVVPGFSMKDELEQLYAAGLTPYEVLQTATPKRSSIFRHSRLCLPKTPSGPARVPPGPCNNVTCLSS
jgi:hypothetical protein